MLEMGWHSQQIIWVLTNYSRKSSIDNIDLRELFLLFAMKRKLKLMSHLINSDDFARFDFTEDNFSDVIENDVYDIGVMLYREYFLKIKNQRERLTMLLVQSFQKANGQLDAKTYLLRRFLPNMRYEHASNFVEILDERVKDHSRGNIFVHTLNVVRTAC
jgi:hypothetical protein